MRMLTARRARRRAVGHCKRQTAAGVKSPPAEFCLQCDYGSLRTSSPLRSSGTYTKDVETSKESWLDPNRRRVGPTASPRHEVSTVRVSRWDQESTQACTITHLLKQMAVTS